MYILRLWYAQKRRYTVLRRCRRGVLECVLLYVDVIDALIGTLQMFYKLIQFSNR